MSSDLDKKILILIPALNPTKEFEEYVDLLIKNDFKNIVVINDGSQEECKVIFDNISKKEGCNIITHDVNQGKGKSLKDGLKYFNELENKNEFSGVITVDCDGQHLVKDILSIAKEMENNSESLLLGTRDFTRKDIPPKSSFGNKATSNVFRLLYGVKISDTQTGLRGIPTNLVEIFSDLSGDRYEYESNMLIECILRKIKLVEIPIETVYIDNNSNSHFRPIHDSISIYWKILNSFIKYSAVSIVSCVIDILLFKIFLSILNISVENTLIIVSTVLARIVSSLVNFGLNKKVAFNSNKKIKSTIIKYYTLCIIQMLVSGFAVSGIFALTHISEVLIKIVVDTILFFINYRVQRIFIFNE